MVLDYTGGVTKVTRQSIRDGSFKQLFSILEEVLPTAVTDVLAGNEIYKRFVDERRIGYGDVNRFLLQDSTLFEVSNIADGVGAIRRQRITGPRAISITTALNGVKVYADEDQILGGKLDITDVIECVARSIFPSPPTGRSPRPRAKAFQSASSAASSRFFRSFPGRCDSRGWPISPARSSACPRNSKFSSGSHTIPRRRYPARFQTPGCPLPDSSGGVSTVREQVSLFPSAGSV
jgi:hypothetical protein